MHYIDGFYYQQRTHTKPTTMKRLFYIIALSTLIISCESDPIYFEPCTLECRWVVEIQGQANTLYEFHNGLRYTIYKDSTANFGTRDQAIPNPNEYQFVGDSIKIDLNFGNFFTALPGFDCNCNVLELSSSQGITRFYKEGYDLSLCD